MLTLLPPVRIGRRGGRGSVKGKRTEGSKGSKAPFNTHALAKEPYYKGKRALRMALKNGCTCTKRKGRPAVTLDQPPIREVGRIGRHRSGSHDIEAKELY